MTDLRKAAQQALEALEWHLDRGAWGADIEGVTGAIRAALAEPEQEPVAWRYDEAKYRPDDLRGRQWHFNVFSTCKPYQNNMVQNVTPLYAAPPQRKPLTDEDIKGIVDVGLQTWTLGESTYEFARAIEKAHGIGGDV